MRPRNYHFWTTKEETRIVEFMKTQGMDILAKELGVTYMSLALKVNYMKRTGRFKELQNKLQSC